MTQLRFQAKAAVICGAIGIVAEVSEEALNKRHSQVSVECLILSLCSVHFHVSLSYSYLLTHLLFRDG